MTKNQFSIKINLTLSKIMGSIVILGGLFLPGFDSSDRVAAVFVGAAMIGVKQFFTSKSLQQIKQDTTTKEDTTEC